MALNFEEYCGYYLLEDSNFGEWRNIYQDVTTEAYDIFGKDIIEKAYLRVAYGTNLEEAKEKIKRGVYQSQKYISYIDVGAEELIIKFTNGKYVWFTTSEWGNVHGEAYENR